VRATLGRHSRSGYARILVALLLVIGLGLGGWLVYAAVYTPTETLYVVNDLRVRASVSSCSSDPLDVSPGSSVAIDPNTHDADAACDIYSFVPKFHYLGCLPVPTTQYAAGDHVRLSDLNRGISAGSCGD
jgi:hypothetical protein